AMPEANWFFKPFMHGTKLQEGLPECLGTRRHDIRVLGRKPIHGILLLCRMFLNLH
uniref:Uncharacterized protein n=1 Tax=Aegilops tauschii subsp. strangulata TaxID=200361 RepID=A0A452XKZ9_AEGTS